MSNSFELCPTLFSRGGRKNLWGLCPFWLRACKPVFKWCNNITIFWTWLSNVHSKILSRKKL